MAKSLNPSVRIEIKARDRHKMTEAKDVLRHLRNSIRLLEGMADGPIIIRLEGLEIKEPDFTFAFSTWKQSPPRKKRVTR